ncbi:MAG: hypothetical protein ABIV06_12955 [Thermoanaerobaculia bacterium]
MAGILICTFVGGLGVLPQLAASDLTWCYPYMGPDSWDWLANGLSWSGVPIPSTFRPPGLPLVITLLDRVSAIPLLPYLTFARLGLAAVLLHRLVRQRHSSLVTALAVLLFVSNGSLFGYTRYVMGEVWTLPFLLAAALAFVRAAGEPRAYLSSALFLSVSFLFHYAGAIVGIAFALAVLMFRRESLATRWPWRALLVALPLPAIWLFVRWLHNRSSPNAHLVEFLIHPSFHNVWYFAVVATALLGLALLPLYLAGLFRLLLVRAHRISPWTQAVLFPLLCLTIFFVLIYDWADKRFLYYLFPFAVAVAAEGIAMLMDWARRGRLHAIGVAVILALMLIWNRIPYPASSHRLLALSPRTFVDLVDGWPGNRIHSGAAGSLALFTADGFFAFARPAGGCPFPAEEAATPALRTWLEAHLEPADPVALENGTVDPGVFWSERRHFAVALERHVVKPGEARFSVRIGGLAGLSQAAPLASFGPFAVVDAQIAAQSEPIPQHPRPKRHRKRARSAQG